MSENSPFTDLPAALVQEVLGITREIGEEIRAGFEDLKAQRGNHREQLREAKLLRHESELPFLTPTACGVDGSYGIERLLAFDLIAAGAVAMEGLTPPSETRFWPEPRHLVHVGAEPHNADTGTILRAVMIGMELSLARHAPHDVVLFDGSLTTPIIFMNQALNKIGEVEAGVWDNSTAARLLNQILETFNDYHVILEAKRSDRNWVAVPKYSTHREIGDLLNWPPAYDDRALLTDLLEPGEFTRPVPLQRPKQPWHINVGPISSHRSNEAKKLAADIASRLLEVRIFYYRPNRHLPALRLEVSRNVAETPGRLAAVVYALKHQCGSPAILEPFPLYMADRMVKKLASSISTFRQVLTQQVSENYQGNITDIFLSLHGYRTETGV